MAHERDFSQDSVALLTVADVAQMLNLGERTIWRLRDRGAMPAPVRLGGAIRGAIRWNRQTLAEWIEMGCPDLSKARRANR
jgi:excisionase family DNA binding protein